MALLYRREAKRLPYDYRSAGIAAATHIPACHPER